MSFAQRAALCAAVLLATACGSHVDDRTPRVATSPSPGAAQAAVAALQAGHFEEARRLADQGVAADDRDPYARVVRAVSRYEVAMQRLAQDGRTLLVGLLDTGSVNQRYLRATFADAEVELAAVADDLAVAANAEGLALELCVACWDIDWNADGRHDRRDRQVLEIEVDADEAPIPEGDPRRRPTFRFDDGDIAWARAFVSFARGALDVALAYDLRELATLAGDEAPRRAVLHLDEPGRIAAARARILEGLELSDACRRAYLAETDDDREWVPNPRQKSHPMPMPVDEALYGRWADIVSDIRLLVEGQTALPIGPSLELLGAPVAGVRGAIDVGKLLREPKDIEIDLAALEQVLSARAIDGALRALLGSAYTTDFEPSALPGRLLRMKAEIERGEEQLGRKLRYLLWLN